MATIDRFATDTISKSNPHLSQLNATIEPAFYSNNATEIPTLAVAYELASHAPNTTVLDAFVANAKDLGLPEDAHILSVVRQKMQRVFQLFATKFITALSNLLLKERLL